jgi:CPA1 family monovalent cation:H+ antiporter
MRGVLALAAAMSLPERLGNGSPFPQRSLIIFLTFCVILATLVLQGLAMPAIIRRLGLAGLGRSRKEELLARREMVQSALTYLNNLEVADPSLAQDAQALEAYYRRELYFLNSPGEVENQPPRDEAERRRQLGRDVRRIEREVLIAMRDEDKIHEEVLRALERELDLLDARFAASD